MPRTSSKGTCYLCNSTFSKAAMSKHLETHLGKEAPTVPTTSPTSQKSQKGKIFRLLVEGYRMPE